MGWDKVEFRCMIQDILGNEIYTNHESNKLADRTIFYCITIPGENDWVRACPKGSKNEFMTNTGTVGSSNANRLSICTNTNSNPNTNANNQTSTGTNSSCNQENSNHSASSFDTKREKNDRLSFSLVNWSYPIPADGKNRSCLIKVYDFNLVEFLRVNDIVQVTGMIEPNEFEDDSQLETNKTLHGGDDNNGTLGSVDSDFEPANDFPHKLVPRVHVKALKKLSHINPLLPEVVTRNSIDINSIKLARGRLSTIITQLLGGDTLASEYLILSLISRIHRRKDVTTLGQLPITIMGIKPEMKFLVDKIYEIITKITTHSHMIDMSIANLNNLRFTPSKDHDNNKMIAGTLQLPDGLYLVLNETALSEGQLTAQGTDNLRTLNQIIRWQKHNYNFKFHSVEIDTDLKVLVFSEGKSILSVPYCVKLEKNDTDAIESMMQACLAVDDFLTEDLLNMFRYYITGLRDVPEYTIPEEVQKSIQDDFVSWRREAEDKGKPLLSADDLSSYMTLARYLTISRGETILTSETWHETCRMESVRQSRLETTEE